MPMNGTQLGDEIEAATASVIEDVANNPPGTPMTAQQLKDFSAAQGQAIINHIVSNAIISTPTGPGSIS